ncbi:MAG: hypothetical protein GY862_15405 [Gammaproteobacteria bacterium]|nr:hypothetical protein [Gammaproteobacteria bacterium]
MRHFYSYGPVDCQEHFCVERRELVARAVKELVGIPEKGGHYLTLWAPRQSGKTWLMPRIKQEISRQYPDKFTLFDFSFEGLRGMNFPDEAGVVDFSKAFRGLLKSVLPGNPEVKSWHDFRELFSKNKGLWDRPLILLTDEVDAIPPALTDLMVAQFRELYLDRETNQLHGLALIGIHALLGFENPQGTPFNIQKSLRVPNLTFDEVKEMFRQYQEESGQQIEAAVTKELWHATKGQPGLVSWFGELLTEKYNPGQDRPIGPESWDTVWHKARFIEQNNAVMDLIAKARVPEYLDFLLELFTCPDMQFLFHDPLCRYLYLHGIIAPETVRLSNGESKSACRFSSPFVQSCLYHALSREMIEDSTQIPALQPLDDLADIFSGISLDLPALLLRYKDYHLKTKGINPWKKQPRRKRSLHPTDAVGYFHLFVWLQAAIGSQCVISPEFPTGNGKVDIHLRCGDRRGIIEVKSFTNIYEARQARKQAAQYAKNFGLERVAVAMFTPVDDEAVLEKLSEEETIEDVQVKTVAIGWT